MCFLQRLLWVDCTAGALVGVAVLALNEWLSHLFALPREVLFFTGAANLLYASFSFSLAVRAVRPMSLIKLLVFANLSWTIVCFGLAVLFWEQASVFGLAHLMGEGVFVGGLAGLEWSQRNRLLTAT